MKNKIVGKDYLEFNMPLSKADMEKNLLRVGGFQLDTFSKSNSVPSNGGVEIKPEDFYEAPFRFLSETIVGADSWKACDFSQDDVLRGALAHFSGKPVLDSHSRDTVKNNVFGISKNAYWQEKSITSSGVSVPAGVNGTIAIDTKTEIGKDLARKIAMGAIFSVSVGIEFDWESSHTFEDKWDFYDNIGKVQKDGRMCCRVAKKIWNINEVSLVHLGADPFAKLIDEKGDIVNPDYGNISILKQIGLSKEQFLENAPECAKKYEIACGYNKEDLSLSKINFFLQKNKEMDVKEISKKLGLNENFDSIESISEYLADNFEKAHKAEKDLSEMKLELANLKSENLRLANVSEKYDRHIKKARSEAERLYRLSCLSKKTQTEEPILKIIQSSDEETIDSFLRTFGIELSGEFRSSENEFGTEAEDVEEIRSLAHIARAN